jgi:hypothetical protein
MKATFIKMLIAGALLLSANAIVAGFDGPQPYPPFPPQAAQF